MYNDLFSIGGLTVHGYGLCIGLGIAAALLLTAAIIMAKAPASPRA